MIDGLASSILFARAPRTRGGIHDRVFYPVAKNNREGSGSNKLCLAVLAWDKARLGALGLGG